LARLTVVMADTTVPEYLRIEPVANRRRQSDAIDPTTSPSMSPTTSDPPTSAQPTKAPRWHDGNILARVRFDDPVLQERLASLACVDWTVKFGGSELEGRVTASDTLCPTVAPAKSSQTPTVAPTPNPKKAKTSAQEDSSAEEGSIAAIVGVLLVMMVILGVVVQRRQRQPPKEGAEKPGFDEFSGAGASKLENISAGIVVVVPATIVVTSAGKRLWSDFRRVISFDVLYYDNPIMKLDDPGFHDDYALLEISCPPGAYLDHLRAVGGRWLNLPFSESNEEDLVDDAVDFARLSCGASHRPDRAEQL